MREVHIGNGETIYVNPSMTTFKEFDWEKLQQYLDSGVPVEAGMQEDWYWTGCDLKQSHIEEKQIAGLSGSDWATPVVLINDEYIPCYVEKNRE